MKGFHGFKQDCGKKYHTANTKSRPTETLIIGRKVSYHLIEKTKVSCYLSSGLFPLGLFKESLIP